MSKNIEELKRDRNELNEWKTNKQTTAATRTKKKDSRKLEEEEGPDSLNGFGGVWTARARSMTVSETPVAYMTGSRQGALPCREASTGCSMLSSSFIESYKQTHSAS